LKSSELLEVKEWSLSWLGLTHPFFTISQNIVINTWIALALILILILPVRWLLKHKDGTARFIIIEYVSNFIDLCKQTLGPYYTFNHFTFITALFTFIFVCNIIVVFPWLEEPTKDLNTTLALGIISFVYTQFYAISSHGFFAYIKEYFTPFFIMFPLHVVGKIASIVSVAFRLFGNIFGSAIIGHIWLSTIEGSVVREVLGIISGMNLFVILGFFGLFEGFLQAFVFTMLSLTYLAIALQGEADEVEA
jgi:F-type H+-transporting ATPase subunit a